MRREKDVLAVLVTFYLRQPCSIPVVRGARLSLLHSVAIKAQNPAVVRISKQLIDEVIARREVSARIPVNACIMHFHSQGTLDGRGKLTADLKAEKGDGSSS